MTTLSCAIANARVKERTKNYDIILSPNCLKRPLGQRRKSELQNSILFLTETQQHCRERFPNSLKAGNSSKTKITKQGTGTGKATKSDEFSEKFQRGEGGPF